MIVTYDVKVIAIVAIPFVHDDNHKCFVVDVVVYASDVLLDHDVVLCKVADVTFKMF